MLLFSFQLYESVAKKNSLSVTTFCFIQITEFILNERPEINITYRTLALVLKMGFLKIDIKPFGFLEQKAMFGTA